MGRQMMTPKPPLVKDYFSALLTGHKQTQQRALAETVISAQARQQGGWTVLKATAGPPRPWKQEFKCCSHKPVVRTCMENTLHVHTQQPFPCLWTLQPRGQRWKALFPCSIPPRAGHPLSAGHHKLHLFIRLTRCTLHEKIPAPQKYAEADPVFLESIPKHIGHEPFLQHQALQPSSWLAQLARREATALLLLLPCIRMP